MPESDYPAKLDIFRSLASEHDELTAAQANRLLHGVVNLQTELGVDPSNPGAAWPTYTNVADVLEDLLRIEQGVFKVTVPQANLWTNGLDVDFVSSGRFTDAAKMYVHVAYAGGPRVGKNAVIGKTPKTRTDDLSGLETPNGYSVVYGDTGGVSDFVQSITTTGFNYRSSIFQNSEEQEWEFWYIAFQAPG